MFRRDLLERVIRTFIAALLTTVLAGMTQVTDMDSAKALAMSATMAAITACISLLARFFGSSDNASFWNNEGNN